MSTTSALHLPEGYRENPAASADADGTPYWSDQLSDPVLQDRALRYQEPVYRYASRRLGDTAHTVLDVGCGTGHKLVKHFARKADRVIGLDQGSGIERARREFPEATWIEGDLETDDVWGLAHALRPDLAICADVIEHLVDPVELLDRIHDVVRGRLVLSTPDRSRLEGALPLGPPLNTRHVREWTMGEVQALVRSRGYEIEHTRHLLPRSYARRMVEVRRATWRLLHRQSVPDRRTCSMLVLRVRGVSAW
jgi:2-polyprenyl-3-methyl-5-hydroxy-6-metoxy-1,4-benzoquinol methylase